MLMNYLPGAWNNGVEIYPEISGCWIEKDGDELLVHCQIVEVGWEIYDAPGLLLRCKHVFLGASTLGSTEIMLRSKERGLSLSDQEVGQRFSSNDVPINGFVNRLVGETDPVGPCIAGMVDD